MVPVFSLLPIAILVYVVEPTPGKRESSIHPHMVPIELPVVTFHPEVTPLERA